MAFNPVLPRAREAAGGEARRLEPADGLLAAGLALAALALYASFGVRLAAGPYLDAYNLAFDFDPVRYVDALARSPADKLGFKHPLILLLRPLGLALVALGAEPRAAAALVMAGFGAAGVAVVCLFLRVVGAPRPEAAALSVLFALTGTQLFTAMIAEAYGPAGFGIAVLWLLAAARLGSGRRLLAGRLAVAVFTFGVTVTNVVQVAIAEAMVALRQAPVPTAARRVAGFGLAAGAIAAVLCAAVWFDELRAALADPVLAVKQVYWLQTKGERSGSLTVLQTFLAYSFVAPAFDVVPVPEDGIDMLDFRSWRYDTAGGLAVGLWLLLLAGGTASWLAAPARRWLGAGLLLALAFNIVFHLDFQFRGSVYLYAAHTHFLAFALACGLAPALARRPAARIGHLALVVALALATAATNLPRAEEFVARFAVRTACASPCAAALP